ncbi:pyridoxine 5'-phosphate synthase [Gynuella sunshinyii]|uniref:Pyridoxine 5'-phosphate synthase n=1 Tax=Gynuella sunshinyii YC6258 TaxID=1445510 RepID=A0A0C5V1A5_9GAMM|nr:pyridoxine 5'-phosphate synthase [Gynuella sunshinyii]AJQ93280.1 pyridoxal phosphate biosynthesis protein [Gynuella sunshinyii YC6258]
MPTALSVNLNKIALLRNSRGRDYPSILKFGRRALQNGARGLTIHPRPDQRHARYQDAYDLRALLEEFQEAELNIEGNPIDEFMDMVLDVGPDQCTLVPDQPGQITSDHGYDLDMDTETLKPVIEKLKRFDVRVSLFMDPVPENMAKARAIGADRVELYTESWAQAFMTPQEDQVYEQFRLSVLAAREAGLEVNAGHDLDLQNLAMFLTIPDIAEVSIGHALTVEALESGYDSVIRQYAAICSLSMESRPNKDF